MHQINSRVEESNWVGASSDCVSLVECDHTRMGDIFVLMYFHSTL